MFDTWTRLLWAYWTPLIQSTDRTGMGGSQWIIVPTRSPMIPSTRWRRLHTLGYVLSVVALIRACTHTCIRYSYGTYTHAYLLTYMQNYYLYRKCGNVTQVIDFTFALQIIIRPMCVYYIDVCVRMWWVALVYAWLYCMHRPICMFIDRNGHVYLWI